MKKEQRDRLIGEIDHSYYGECDFAHDDYALAVVRAEDERDAAIEQARKRRASRLEEVPQEANGAMPASPWHKITDHPDATGTTGGIKPEARTSDSGQ